MKLWPLLLLIFSLKAAAQVDLSSLSGYYERCGIGMSQTPYHFICGRLQGYVRPDTPLRSVMILHYGISTDQHDMPADCNTVACLYGPTGLIKKLGKGYSIRSVELFEYYPMFSAPVDNEGNTDDPTYISRINGERDPTVPGSVEVHCYLTPSLPTVPVTLVQLNLEALWADKAQQSEEVLRKVFCSLKEIYEGKQDWEHFGTLLSSMPFEREDCSATP